MTATDEPQGGEQVPDLRVLVVDVRQDRVGEVMASTGGRLSLRPPSGGREWEAFPCDVRPMTASDELRARVIEVNDRSRREWGTV
ncbi:hypothetical protein [Streptomyces sp. NPDC002537]